MDKCHTPSSLMSHFLDKPITFSILISYGASIYVILDHVLYRTVKLVPKLGFTYFSKTFQQNVSCLKLFKNMSLLWNSIFGQLSYNEVVLRFFFFFSRTRVQFHLNFFKNLSSKYIYIYNFFFLIFSFL